FFGEQATIKKMAKRNVRFLIISIFGFTFLLRFCFTWQSIFYKIIYGFSCPQGIHTKKVKYIYAIPETCTI
ncbi:MAG TPA: hypothetical protein VLA03_00400, partial [Draconibacterium sp.]|nr:hypothetical protein [Draconibacterium sp.]